MSVLSVTRGDTATLTVTLSDENAALINLDGKTLKFTVKQSVLDADDDALISKATGTGITHDPDQAGAGKGIATIAIDAADTATLDLSRRSSFPYDVQLVGGADVKTPLTGKFVVAYDVTRVSA